MIAVAGSHTVDGVGHSGWQAHTQWMVSDTVDGRLTHSGWCRTQWMAGSHTVDGVGHSGWQAHTQWMVSDTD